MQLAKRLGAAFGAVAAFRRGHDHADAELRACVSDAIVIGGHEHARDSRHSAGRFDAALDQRLGYAAYSFQLNQRLSRIAGRLIARGDQDRGLHRAAGQSWMWSTPTGFLPRPSSSTTNKAVILYSSNSASASSIKSSAPTVCGSRVMNSPAV